MEPGPLNPACLPPGTQVGPWRVVSRRGMGTYGAVYLAVGGDNICDITLDAGEYVIAAFGHGGSIDSGSINQIYFRTNLGRQFGGGAPASTWFQALSPQGVGACLSGFTSALQGSILNSVSFIWRFETPTTPGFDPIAWLDLPGLTGG